MKNRDAKMDRLRRREIGVHLFLRDEEQSVHGNQHPHSVRRGAIEHRGSHEFANGQVRGPSRGQVQFLHFGSGLFPVHATDGRTVQRDSRGAFLSLSNQFDQKRQLDRLWLFARDQHGRYVRNVCARIDARFDQKRSSLGGDFGNVGQGVAVRPSLHSFHRRFPGGRLDPIATNVERL